MVSNRAPNRRCALIGVQLLKPRPTRDNARCAQRQLFRSRVKKAESSEMASVGEVSEDSILFQESVTRGHHVFKEIWTPRLSEILLVNQEAGNAH